MYRASKFGATDPLKRDNPKAIQRDLVLRLASEGRRLAAATPDPALAAQGNGSAGMIDVFATRLLEVIDELGDRLNGVLGERSVSGFRIASEALRLPSSDEEQVQFRLMRLERAKRELETAVTRSEDTYEKMLARFVQARCLLELDDSRGLLTHYYEDILALLREEQQNLQETLLMMQAKEYLGADELRRYESHWMGPLPGGDSSMSVRKARLRERLTDLTNGIERLELMVARVRQLSDLVVGVLEQL